MIESVLKMSPTEILNLKACEVNRFLAMEEIEYIFKSCDAFWYHPGKKNIQAPHAKLTTGKHSDIYINCPLVLCHSNLSQIMGKQIAEHVLKLYKGNIDWVTGSDSSALALSKDVANFLGAKWHPMQKVKSEGGEEKQAWEKMVIKPDETVLHVEELMVTSVTALRVRKGIREAHPDYPINFVPILPVLVFRPSEKDFPIKTPAVIDRSEVFPVLNYRTFVVDPKKEKCPLCAKGSEALAPKGENWRQMVATM